MSPLNDEKRTKGKKNNEGPSTRGEKRDHQGINIARESREREKAVCGWVGCRQERKQRRMREKSEQLAV